jgi:hypothetical protein
MLLRGTDLWPLLWLVIGCGSVVTVVLSLFIATVPAPRRRPRRQPAPNRHHDDAVSGYHADAEDLGYRAVAHIPER